MTTRFFASKIAILAIIAVSGGVSLSSRAAAQETLPPDRTVAPAAPDFHARLTMQVEALAQRYGVRVVLDPDMEVTAEVAMPEKRASLTTALNQVARQMKNAAWRCVTLKRNADLPSPEKLSAMVRALDRLPQTELMVENPTGEQGTLLLSQPQPRTPDTPSKDNPLDTTPVYLLYNTALPADGKTAAERVADEQKSLLKLMAQLPPEQRSNPLSLGLQALQRLQGGRQEAALRGVGAAGMTAWQNTAPDTRDKMIQHFMQTVENSPPPNPGTIANPGTGAAASRNYINTLRDIADTLAKQHRVRILIDPDLYVVSPPAHPGSERTLRQALDTLTKSVSGSAWRIVYQKPPAASAAALPVRSLVAMVRTLDTLVPNTLRVDNLLSRRRVMLQTDLTASSLRAKLSAYSFSDRPTYLLYATQEDGESGQSVAQRLERRQVRQMELLLNMPPRQITQVMTEALTQYAGATGDTQSQMMRLPIMALLMGVWFPQKAKEERVSAPPF